MLPLLSITIATLLAGSVATFVSGARARWVALGVSVVFIL